jgi:hypothetical protein
MKLSLIVGLLFIVPNYTFATVLTTSDSIILESDPTISKVITGSNSFHYTDIQPYQLTHNQIKILPTIQSNVLTLNLYNLDSTLPIKGYNLNHILNTNSKINIMIVKNDLSQSWDYQYDYEPQDDIQPIVIKMPKGFKHPKINECYSIITTYQLKGYSEPISDVKFIYNHMDEYIQTINIKDEIPENCTIQIPHSQASLSIASQHFINFSYNPYLNRRDNSLSTNIHATKEGRPIILDIKDTIIANNDFTSVQFIQPLEPFGSTAFLKSNDGLKYRVKNMKEGEYLFGFSFIDNNVKKWIWNSIKIK